MYSRCMHVAHSPQLPAVEFRGISHSRRTAGFSLVEVTLAIGIIAFAFVALFALLPVGMTTFRAAVDATNDSIILQDMNAMVLVTQWAKIDELDSKRSGEVYYFDEEGRRTDSKLNPITSVESRRLYQVKLLIENFYEPTAGTAQGASMPNARRIIVVIGDVGKPPSELEFKNVNSSSDFAGKTTLRTRAFIATRMESLQTGT